jgi:hypothetical protein
MSEGILGGNIAGIASATITFNPASVAANTTAEQTVTVPGVLPGDIVQVVKPTLTAGLGIVNTRVSAANTVAIQFINNTAAPIDAAAEAYTFVVYRFSGRRSLISFG